MKKTAVLSSHYFPCIAYFALLLKHPKVVLDFGEHYLKQSYRNRCKIYSSNGVLPLSIPVLKQSKTAVKDVVLDQRTGWRKLHWKSICAAYNSSPFFEFYLDDLKAVFFKDYTSLAQLNTALLEHLCKEIDVQVALKTSHEYLIPSDQVYDYRQILDAKKPYPGAENYPRYIQIFEEKNGFIQNLSILDLLFHEGPETLNYLKRLV